MDDAELLRGHLADPTGPDFRELVNQHVNFVYSTALRQTQGNHHLAGEVSQIVFSALARKAATLARHPALPAWLYRSACLAAADLRRREARRKSYELAFAAEAPDADRRADEADWDRIRPVLDAELNRLGERDRSAVVLRYFTHQPFKEVGRRLGLSENAARMRVERALDKVREGLARRGLTSTSAALAAGIAAEASATAPISAAAAATAAGMTAGASGTAGLLVLMSANKTLLAAFGLVLAAGTSTVIFQDRANARLDARIADLKAENGQFENLQQEHRLLTAGLREARDLQDSVSDGPAVLAKLKSAQKKNADLIRQMMADAAQRRANAAAGGRFNGEYHDLSSIDQVPQPIVQIRPQYPFEMRRAGISGQVVVDFIVDASGNVRNATAVSSTQPEFEQAAVDAVSAWTFDPGRKGGVGVNTHMQIPIVFTLPTAAPSPASGNSSPSDWFETSSTAVPLGSFEVIGKK
jgi:RNA polymerase sigma factor (sigma-70 family)